MDQDHQALKAQLVLAHRIMCNEGVLDTFGHVSARLPAPPERFLLSASVAPNRIRSKDLVIHDFDANDATGSGHKLYGERFLHAAIYAARADVSAICHHHPAALLPYCATGALPVPVSQAGAAAGPRYAWWDSRDEFGDTNLLVSDLARGRSLARALGNDWVVLMSHHGVTTVGRSLTEAVYRAISVCENARTVTAARQLGTVEPMSNQEVRCIEPGIPAQAERAWQFWTARLD